jgi:hypothetical protein
VTLFVEKININYVYFHILFIVSKVFNGRKMKTSRARVTYLPPFSQVSIYLHQLAQQIKALIEVILGTQEQLKDIPLQVI